jgi:hypothetical protein
MTDGAQLVERRALPPANAPWELVRHRSLAYLRRRRAKEMLVAHGFVVAAMAALTAWWVVPHHAFSGRTIYVFSPGRGLHLGDLPAVLFVLVGLFSLGQVVRAASRLAEDR